jgi:hypothetical protein
MSGEIRALVSPLPDPVPAAAPPEVYLPMEGGQVRIGCLLQRRMSECTESLDPPSPRLWRGKQDVQD